MNVENIKRVRDHIARLPPEQLNMEYFNAPCGTAHCIAGWAVVVLGLEDRPWDSAAKAFGLSAEAAHALFYVEDRPDTDRLWKASPGQAVAVLDHLLATGEVDWSVASGTAA